MFGASSELAIVMEFGFYRANNRFGRSTFLHRVLFTQTSTSAVPHSTVFLITFRVRYNRGEMYIGHGRLCLCVCLSVPRRILTLLYEPGCNLAEWQGVPSSRAVFGRICGRRTNAKCQRVLVLALCLVVVSCDLVRNS